MWTDKRHDRNVFLKFQLRETILIGLELLEAGATIGIMKSARLADNATAERMNQDDIRHRDLDGLE